jgi:hypothetical protein
MLLILISLIFSASKVAKCFIKIGRYSIVESGYWFPSGRLMIYVTMVMRGRLASPQGEWNRTARRTTLITYFTHEMERKFIN